MAGVSETGKLSMKKNVIWNTFGSVFYCVCQWLITIIIVRLSSYENAGYLSLAMTTSSSFSAIALFNMRNFQVSDVKGEYSSNIYVGSRIVTCIVAFFLCAVTAVYGNSLFQILCIDAFMLVRVAEAIVDVMHGINQKYERYDYIGKSYIIRGIVTVSSFVAGVMFTNNLVVTLFAMAFLNLGVAFFYDWRRTETLEHFTPKIRDKKVMDLLKRCFPIVIFSFLLSLENLLPKNLLKQYFGPEELGIYSSMASPTLVVQVFASVAFNPFLPRFSEMLYRGEIKRFRHMLHILYLMLAGMSIVVTIGAMLVGKLGLRILFGEAILQYYYLFMPIVWCTIFTAIIWILSAILVALRKIAALLVGMIINFGLCVGIAQSLILQYEKNGISFVQLIVYGIYIVFMIGVCEITLHKLYGKEEKHRI